MDYRGCLFVIASQSGRSPDLVANAEWARSNGALVVSLLNDTRSPVADASDVVVDLHAGGSSMEILTVGMMRRPADAAAARSIEAAVRAFGAPNVLVVTGNAAASTTLVGAALSRGLVTFAVELGCRGSVAAGALAIARRGIRNMLVHFGLTAGEPCVVPPPVGKSRRMCA